MTKLNSNTPSLLAAAAAAVPESAKFDLKKDQIVKQQLVIPLVKVLPKSPTVARLFDSAQVYLFSVKRNSREKLYPFDNILLEDPALKPFIHLYLVASGRTSEGDQFVAYCREPDIDRANRFHLSGKKAMQIAFKEPVALKPYEEADDAYTAMCFGPDATPPEIKEPDYSFEELYGMAFDGREVLSVKSAAIIELKVLKAQRE